MTDETLDPLGDEPAVDLSDECDDDSLEDDLKNDPVEPQFRDETGLVPDVDPDADLVGQPLTDDEIAGLPIEDADDDLDDDDLADDEDDDQDG